MLMGVTFELKILAGLLKCGTLVDFKVRLYFFFVILFLVFFLRWVWALNDYISLLQGWGANNALITSFIISNRFFLCYTGHALGTS